MIERYRVRWAEEILNDTIQLANRVQVEMTTWEVQYELGIVPEGPPDDWAVTMPSVEFEVELEERVTRHDVVALANVLNRRFGTRWVHYGLTSSDVVDTANAMMLNQFRTSLIGYVDDLCERVFDMQSLYDGQVAGRTHGQLAVPIQWGHRVKRWLGQIDEALRQFKSSDPMRGKLSGPCGEYLEPLSRELERHVMKRLGLRVQTRAVGQIVNRGDYSRFVFGLVQISQAIEQLATDLRLLSINGVGEVAFPKAKGQVGSSSMPHKSNPILAERLCGQARLMRGYLLATLETETTWLERDISNSCVERVALIDACYTISSMVEGAVGMVRGTRTQEGPIGVSVRDPHTGSYQKANQAKWEDS